MNKDRFGGGVLAGIFFGFNAGLCFESLHYHAMFPAFVSGGWALVFAAAILVVWREKESGDYKD